MKNSAIAVVIVLGFTVASAAQAKGGHGGGGHSGGSHSGGSHSGASHPGKSTGGHTNSSDHNVAGYTKKNGTQVAPHHATDPNGSKRDNYSSKGNTNPYTGKQGTKDPNK